MSNRAERGTSTAGARSVPVSAPADDDVVVVRGGVLHPEVLGADAERNHAVYGIFGVSVFAIRNVTLDELAQAVPLVRFERLTLMTVGVIRRAGLALEPTGRNPRHYDIVFAELGLGVASLCACEHRVWLNPYPEP